MPFIQTAARRLRAVRPSPPWPPNPLPARHRALTTLAIETSCDDTSVAVLTKTPNPPHDRAERPHPLAKLHYHRRITADNTAYRGIHPIASLDSHERSLGLLIREALTHLPSPNGPNAGPPDFVSVTRGPGMRGALNTGLNTAKGLALAFGVPLLGVHHMQAHALTPRLVAALSVGAGLTRPSPAFPFLTLLVSGGHTLLLESRGLTDHPILAATADVAVGDAVDKIARHVLPEEVIASSDTAMYGAVLERFAFPDVEQAHGYAPPGDRAGELRRHVTTYGWGLTPPLTVTRAGKGSKSMEFSFTGLVSAVRRISEERVAASGFGEGERRVLAGEAMRVAFEHLAGRVVTALRQMDTQGRATGERVGTVVVSGGVAANRYLKAILRAYLDARGYPDVELVFPPPDLCTDNAAMIGWAGMEMFEAGWESDVSCQSLHKWSLDSASPDGGIVGVPGWKRRDGFDG